MLIERIAKSFTSQLPAGLDPLRTARVFVRRAGPFFSINVIITTIEVHEGSAGDLHTTVHLAGGEPVQDVVTGPSRRASVPPGGRTAVPADVATDGGEATRTEQTAGATAPVGKAPSSERASRRQTAAATKRSAASSRDTSATGSRPRRAARPRTTPPPRRPAKSKSKSQNGQPESGSAG